MRLMRSSALLFALMSGVGSMVSASALAAQAAGVFVLGDRDGRGRDTRGRNERLLFTWSGRVDREAVLTLRGRALDVRGDRDLFGRNGRSERANASVPRDVGEVFVRVAEGRGDVDILQRPTSRNDWTLIVRVRDPRAGDDRYRLSAFWVGDDRDGWGRDDDWGRGRNDRRDRDDRRNRDDDWGRGGDWGRDDDWGRNGARLTARWSGLVDDDVELRIQGRSIRVIDRNGSPTRDVRSTVRQSLGRDDVVRLLDANGRGSVTVVQQPAPWNGNTAIVRIRDRQSGADRYDLTFSW